MVVYIKRPISLNNTIIAFPAIASVEIIQQLTDDGEPKKFSLIIAGIFQGQWFVAEREESKIDELETIRDALLKALQKEESVEVQGDNIPTFG